MRKTSHKNNSHQFSYTVLEMRHKTTKSSVDSGKCWTNSDRQLILTFRQRHGPKYAESTFQRCGGIVWRVDVRLETGTKLAGRSPTYKR